MIKRCQEMVIIIIYCILLITYYLLNQNEIHQHADRNITISFCSTGAFLFSLLGFSFGIPLQKYGEKHKR